VSKTFALTDADVGKWRQLIRCALDVAAGSSPAARLRGASQRAVKAVAPDSDSLREVFSPLVRLAGAWPDMSAVTRAVETDKLVTLARLAERSLSLTPYLPKVAALPAAPIGRPAPPFRKDLFG